LAFVRFYLMYLFIVFCYPHHYKTFTTATSNTIGGHLGKGKNVQVGIKAVYLTLRLFYFPRHWKIAKNPGFQFGQKENASQTQIISQPADLFKLVMNPAIVVDNVTILNDEGVLASWECVEEDISPLKTVNVVVAAYTTAMARLELYKHLEQLGERVLYYDTDSVIFVSSENDWEPPVGDFLGDLTDEMVDYGAGSHITEFVSAGPKNDAYKFWCGGAGKFDTVCKVKGVTLHYENSGYIYIPSVQSEPQL
jgi:hypothetical protein